MLPGRIGTIRWHGDSSWSACTPSDPESRRASWPALSTIARAGDHGPAGAAGGHPDAELDLGQGVAGAASKPQRRSSVLARTATIGDSGAGTSLEESESASLTGMAGQERLRMRAARPEHRTGTDHEAGPVHEQRLGQGDAVFGQRRHQSAEHVTRRGGGGAGSTTTSPVVAATPRLVATVAPMRAQGVRSRVRGKAASSIASGSSTARGIRTPTTTSSSRRRP